MITPNFDFSIFGPEGQQSTDLTPRDLMTEANRQIGIVTFSDGLIVKDGCDWITEAALKPISKQLFGELWHQDELCILFGDTGTGKSILAYQISESIAQGIPTPLAALQVPAQGVLYIDCELSDKQVLARYSRQGQDPYLLHRNFKRAELNPDLTPPIGMEYDECVAKCIEQKIKATGARILIVDNISYLKNETEKAKDALSLMKYLKALKNSYGLSILVLAHTPKRDQSQEININHLAGSKALANFCDSAFAISQSSQDPGLRYIKQVKARNTEVVYHSQNIILCSIQKPENNFLSFHFCLYSTEQEHLKEWTAKEREARIEEVKELHEKGYTEREIAAKLNISKSVVNKYRHL